LTLDSRLSLRVGLALESADGGSTTRPLVGRCSRETPAFHMVRLPAVAWVVPLRGKMKTQTFLCMSETAGFSCRPRVFPSFPMSIPDKFMSVTSKMGIVSASGILLILLALFQTTLDAQRAPAPNQNWTQSDLYSNPYPQQFAPNQPPGYGHPSYSQQLGYDQQPQLAHGQPQYGLQQPHAQRPYSDPAQPYPPQGYGQAQISAQPLNTEQLEQLVAPIALYPDTLVAQILAASTYPDQVVDADHWRQAQGYASPDQIAGGASAQSWDPSLKGLTAFPQVLLEMDQNLRWTIALGNAYYNQPQDVLDVIQVMRQRAETAGNLQTTSQESVSYDQGYIQVAPANPQVVYLPAYDPWTAYGQPITPYRGFSMVGALGSFFDSSFGSGAVRFGLGVAMSAFTHTSFGWLGWGLDWLSHVLLFNNSNYYSHSRTVADWGFPHGGPRAVYQRGAFAGRAPSMSNRGSQNAYPRPVLGYASTSENGFARPIDRYAGNRLTQAPDRANSSFSAPGSGDVRPPMQAYNREPQFARSQQYSRPATVYGSGFGGARRNLDSSRPGLAYNMPSPAYRAPASRYVRGEIGQRYPGSFASRGFEGFSEKQERAGSFRSFGGHEPKAPQAPKMDKGFSRGHAERGGHPGGLFGGKHHR